MQLVPTYNGWLCPDDPGEPGSHQKRWSVNAIEARIVSELFRGLNVLEIGTGLGVSTREIAKRAKMVYTVDIDPWVRKNVVLPENAKFFSSTNDVPEGLDAAFIDGLHSYAQCTQDIKDARRIVKDDGLFVFHDAKMKAVEQAIRNSKMEVVWIGTYAGMALGWSK
jgi:predicted O-methyltransferase YrrM